MPPALPSLLTCHDRPCSALPLLGAKARLRTLFLFFLFFLLLAFSSLHTTICCSLTHTNAGRRVKTPCNETQFTSFKLRCSTVDPELFMLGYHQDPPSVKMCVKASCLLYLVAAQTTSGVTRLRLGGVIRPNLATVRSQCRTFWFGPQQISRRDDDALFSHTPRRGLLI